MAFCGLSWFGLAPHMQGKEMEWSLKDALE
jgi:hypothetical protein